MIINLIRVSELGTRMQERNVQLSEVCESLSEVGDIRKDETREGRNSLIGATFVQAHNAIGTGLLLFPYTFWAFGGIAGGTLIQLVIIRCRDNRAYYAPSIISDLHVYVHVYYRIWSFISRISEAMKLRLKLKS